MFFVVPQVPVILQHFVFLMFFQYFHILQHNLFKQCVISNNLILQIHVISCIFALSWIPFSCEVVDLIYNSDKGKGERYMCIFSSQKKLYFLFDIQVLMTLSVN